MTGKNVLIIGASGDIGQATAIELARQGHCLILHYNTNQTGIERIQQSVEVTRILSVIQSDLSHSSGSSALLEAIAFHVDAVVFAGGNACTELFQDTSEITMDKMLMLHVKSPWVITKGLLPSMIQSGSGNIIFITSIWGEYGGSMEVIYSAVKGAQNSFVKALGEEISHTDVSVNAVSPGYIDTKMNANLSEDEKNTLYLDIPLKKAGSPEDVAYAVRFLLSDGICFQGGILPVNGGWIPNHSSSG